MRTVWLCLTAALTLSGQDISRSANPYTDKTPSKSMYFDWVNRNWEGSNESKVLSNLQFFKWMRDEYGMQLDIFMLDAGTFDNGPNCGRIEGRPAYGDLQSPWFTENFPHGFQKLFEAASSFGARLGLWIGIDGYGDTAAEAQRRLDLFSRLTRDYGMGLFKFDACCSGLRPEKEKYFIQAMTEVRKAVPDLIVLNHRIKLSEKAGRFATTFLWEGMETYIDVSGTNSAPAPHHRLFTMQRGLPPGLQRLTEDCGVCLSSALDYWEDDLVLQTFNRALILSPEIYGSPWLLRDDEFPRLARIFKLHRKYNAILVNGMTLPEADYGPFAVARGDGVTRFVTMRNLTWKPVRRRIRLDSSVGLTGEGDVEVRQYHPTERLLGIFHTGDEVAVDVLPFRSSLVMATTKPNQELSLAGTDYQVTRDVPGRPVEILVLGMPGTATKIKLAAANRKFTSATLDGAVVPALLKGEAVAVAFPGKPLKESYHRKLADLAPGGVPADAEALYEAACYAGDSNALEVRSLGRSGATKNKAVQAARDAFFKGKTFVSIGVWDKFAFDGDLKTAFKARRATSSRGRTAVGALRVDLGRSVTLSRLVLRDVPAAYQPGGAEISADLREWIPVTATRDGADAVIAIPAGRSVQYVRVQTAPLEVAEIEGYNGNAALDRKGWRASNLFRLYKDASARAAWSVRIRLAEVAKNSYLAVAIPGRYGAEGAYAALRVDDRIVGAADRAASYPFNNFEAAGNQSGNYTYYFPVTEALTGREIEVEVLGFSGDMQQVKPDVWITAYPIPFEAKTLTLGAARQFN